MLKALGKYWQASVVASMVGVVAVALIAAPMATLGLSTSVDTTRPGDPAPYFLGETVDIVGEVDLNASESVNKVFLKIEGPEPLDVELPIQEGNGIPIPIPAGTLTADIHLEGVEPGGSGYGYGGYGGYGGYSWIAPVGGIIHYLLHYTPPIFLSDPPAPPGEQTIVGTYTAKLIAKSPFETQTSPPKYYTMNKNMELIVTIDEPEDGLFINTPTASIPAHGTVNDVTVYEVHVSVENPAVGLVPVGAVPVDPATLEWSTMVPLFEGMNTIMVHAMRDAYPPILEDTAEVHVVRDTVAPEVFITGLPSSTQETSQIATVDWDEPNPELLEVRLENSAGTFVLLTRTTFPEGVHDVDVPMTLAEGNNRVIAEMTDLAGNHGMSFFDVFVDIPPSIVNRGPLYPIGEVSARPGKHVDGDPTRDRPGDPVFFQFKVTPSASGLRAVVWPVPGPAGADPILVPLLRRDQISEPLLRSIGAAPDANYFLPIGTPIVPPGTFSVHVLAISNTGLVADAVQVAQVRSNLSMHNNYLMPGDNFISLPLLNLASWDNRFDIATLLQRPVPNVAGSFVSTLDHPTVLADLVDSIYYWTGGTAGVWRAYIPGPAADDLPTAGQGMGLWVRMKAEAFEMFPPVNGLDVDTPSPVKLTIAGAFLRPGSIVPAIYPVPAGWSAVGLANEQAKPVSQFVSGRIDFSLLRYRNELVPWGDVWHGPSVAYYPGSFENLFYGDFVRPGDGMWLYFSQPGALTP